MTACRVLLTTVLLLAAGPTLSAAQPEEPRPAMTVAEGSVARRQVVAVGRDLVVAGEALSDVAALNGSVRVSGRVTGDVIVMGGDAILGPAARVGGDVCALGGEIQAAPGASIGGRSVAYPTAPSTWLVLMEGPSLGLSPASPLILGLKLALLSAWLATTLLLLGTARRDVLSTADGVRREPFRNFFIGLVGVMALVLTVVFLSAFVTVLVGIPLLILLVLVAFVLKLWGMVAVFCALGQAVVARLGRPTVLPLNAAMVGLLLLGVLKLVPWLGTWVWTLATLIGVGATLSTKFGRREPWFDLGEVDDLALAGRS